MIERLRKGGIRWNDSLLEAVLYRGTDHHELWFELEVLDDGVVRWGRLGHQSDQLDSLDGDVRQRPDQDLEVVHTIREDQVYMMSVSSKWGRV